MSGNQLPLRQISSYLRAVVIIAYPASIRSVALSEETNDNRLFFALVALVVVCVVGFVISVR